MGIFESIVNFFVDLFNGLIDWVLELLNAFLGGLGELIGSWLLSLGLTIEIPSTVFDILNEVTLGIGYIVPVSSLMPIVYFWLTFYGAKIVFAVYSLIANTIIKRITVKV